LNGGTVLLLSCNISYLEDGREYYTVHYIPSGVVVDVHMKDLHFLV